MSKESQLNKVITIVSERKKGRVKSLRIRHDYSNCPTLTEQHSAHMTDLNYLIEKYKPDELAAYMAARESYRRQIMNHDFTQEPDLQGVKNHVYNLRKAFDELPDDIKMNFRNAVEFYSFIDNPENQKKLVNLKVLTQAQIDKLTSEKAATASSVTQDSQPKP